MWIKTTSSGYCWPESLAFQWLAAQPLLEPEVLSSHFIALQGFLHINLYSYFWTQVSLNNQFFMTRSPTAEVPGTWITAVYLYPGKQKEFLFIHFVPQRPSCPPFVSQSAESLAVPGLDKQHKLKMSPVHRRYCSCLSYTSCIFSHTVIQLQKEEEQSCFLHSSLHVC